MPKLVIDNRNVEVEEGATILDAAAKLGIEIPTMCFMKSFEASTSCMVCVVKVEGLNKLAPACRYPAQDDMRVETNSKEVIKSRRAALELLLSDHVGDCMGPCRVGCPAGMDIPMMIRQIAAGKLNEAIETVKKDIALPAVLGRICPAPCEKVCRRKLYDSAVSICLLKRYAADKDLQSAKPYTPKCKSKIDKHVAIIGAGPTGLSAAYYLLREGIDCTIFDEHQKPGGALRYSISHNELPEDVLDAEIRLIEQLGLKFNANTKIGRQLSLDDLCKDYNAVFVACGELKPGDSVWSKLEKTDKGLLIDRRTYATSAEGVFAGGDITGKRKLAVRAAADGKEAAISISQYLPASKVTEPKKPFNCRIGKLNAGEIERFMTDVNKDARANPSAPEGGFTDAQSIAEAKRCLHCDCRKGDNCKLRDYAQHYEAKLSRYKGERRMFVQKAGHQNVIYEQGKCIDCGLCIKITMQANEELGLTFIGRGFDVSVAVPFDGSIDDGLKQTAAQCIKSCPTGALSFRLDF